MVKVGDTVRFLNEVGGGRVSRIDEKQKLVYVEDADGFEIPVQAHECVVVNNVKANNLPMTERELLEAERLKSPTAIAAAAPVAEQLVATEAEVVETPEGEDLNVQIAFVPQNIKLLQTTAYDVVLVNDSNYWLYYNIVLLTDEAGKGLSVANGLLEPNTTDQFAELKKDQLNQWEHLRVQVLPLKRSKDYTVQQVIDVDIHLNLVHFFKLHTFTSNPYFDDPAWLITLDAKRETERQRQLVEQSMQSGAWKQKDKPQKAPKPQPQPRPEVIEVDLHIQQLMDTTAGMSSGDMLSYQLEQFRKTMDENKKYKGQKIVFIHGKGDGVLRREIENILRKEYATCSFQDASFQKYGFGAKLVVIG